MKVYLDTGFFIDYLLFRSPLVSTLRSGDRRGRDPARLSRDAEECMSRLRRSHDTFTSAFMLHEAERTLFDSLSVAARGMSDKYRFLVMSARALSAQVLATTQVAGIAIVPLGSDDFLEAYALRELDALSILPADALHVVAARRLDAEVVVTGDRDLLRCDGKVANSLGKPMRCVDTDEALAIL